MADLLGLRNAVLVFGTRVAFAEPSQGQHLGFQADLLSLWSAVLVFGTRVTSAEPSQGQLLGYLSEVVRAGLFFLSCRCHGWFVEV